MLRLIGLLLLLAGAGGLALRHLPADARQRLPRELSDVRLPVGDVTFATLGTVGLLLLLWPRRRSGAPLADDPLRRLLAKREFLLVTEPNGWRAEGEWKRVPVIIRRSSGFEASRFALPWVISVEVRGRPREPWPLPPTDGKIIDVRDHGFTVSLPAVTHAQDRLASLVDAVVDASVR